MDAAANGAAGRSGASSRLSLMDRWGMAISSLCLVHCIMLPLALAFLPALAAVLPHDGWVHPLLISTAVPVTGAALWRGYRMHHAKLPALLGAFGLSLIAMALCFSEPIVEAALTVVGGLIVSAAHLANWRSHSVVPQGRMANDPASKQ